MKKNRGVKVLYGCAALVVIAAGMRLAQSFLWPVLLATFIAIVTAPIVMALCDRGVHRALAVIAGLTLDLAAGAALGLPLAGALTKLSERLPQYQRALGMRMEGFIGWLGQNGVDAETLFTLDDSTWLVNLATDTAQLAAGLAWQIVLVFLILAFMLFEATGIREKLAQIASREQIERWTHAAHEVNTYLVAKTVLSLITGVAVFVWCWSRDLDLPLLWGLLAYLFNFIPTVGQLIAAVPAIGLALIQLGPGPALVLAFGYGVINLAIGAIEPRVMGDALGLSALVVLISMVVWGWLLGPVGALLSAPLTMLIRHAFAYSEEMQWVAHLLGPIPSPNARAGPATADEASAVG